MRDKALGTYAIEARLGAGGMGTVYLARSTVATEGVAAGERVAVKVVHRHLLTRPEVLDRFRREGEIGRAVRHGNVVRTLDVGEFPHEGGVASALVMEFVEGQTLRSLLDELGRVPEDLSRHIAREVARGLEAIHAAGAVHRDVKPENVIITAEHEVKLMDLGVARVVDEAVRQSSTGNFVGSLLYAAPEQFLLGGAVDARADLYSLGLTLYELATAHHPFQSDDIRDMMSHRPEGELTDPREFAQDLSPFFCAVLTTLLREDPEERFPSSSALRRVLEDEEAGSWWLDRADRDARPSDRIRIPRPTAFHGRENELSSLGAAFDDAAAGRGAALLLEGPAGIGKTRLVHEFARRLDVEGSEVDILYGGHGPAGTISDMGGFADALRGHWGTEKLRDAACLPDHPDLASKLAALIGDGAVENVSGEEVNPIFLAAIRSLGTRRPTVVFIDDLQFAPAPALSIFAAVAQGIADVRVLLVGAMRPEPRPAWAEGDPAAHSAVRVELSPLGPEDVGRLVRDALGSRSTPPDLIPKVVRWSGGNPLRALEIARPLGRTAPSAAPGQELPPGTVSARDLISAGIGSIGESERDLLGVACCIGFEFDLDLLAEARGDSPILTSMRLASIEARHGFVHSIGRGHAFEHHRIQEVLYETLPPAVRKLNHLAIARAISVLSGAAAKPTEELEGRACADLGRHFLLAHRADLAQPFLAPALAYLDLSFHREAAIGLIDIALAAPGGIETELRIDLLLGRAKHLTSLGRMTEGRESLLLAADSASEAGDLKSLAKARIEIGRLHFEATQLPEALGVLEEAARNAREAGDLALEASALGGQAAPLRLLGKSDEAKGCLERQIEIAREIGDPDLERAASVGLGAVLIALGRPDEAIPVCEGCRDMSREAGDRGREMYALGNMGQACIALGRTKEAVGHSEAALGLAMEIGDLDAQGSLAMDLGNALMHLGHLADSREYLEQALRLAGESGKKNGEIVSRISLALLHVEAGDPGASLGMSDAVQEMSRELGVRIFSGYSLACRGLALAETEHAPGAEESFRAAVDCFREAGEQVALANSLNAGGGFFLEQGRFEEARSWLLEAREIGRPMGNSALLAEVVLSLSLLPGGDPSTAMREVEPHLDELSHREALAVRHLLFRATGDDAHLEEARRHQEYLLAHAGEGGAEKMLANVTLHRRVAEALRRRFLREE